ncbi:MAG: histidine phosphatase family protein [Pseudomonadota bacterium]
MRATIFLARHGTHAEAGQILSGRSGIALSPAGEAQAERLGRLARRERVAKVQTSPRARTVRTARIVADALGVDTEIESALDEIDFGDWTGRSFATLESDPAWVRWNEARHVAATPNGETMASATQRATSHLDALAASGADRVLCVSHCDVIRGAVAHYLGLSLDRLLHFDVDPGSLTTLVLDGKGGRLVRLNEVPA